MALVKWGRTNLPDPFVEFDRLQDEMSRLFGLVNGPGYSGLFDRSTSPAIDVQEDDDGVTVWCDVPGVAAKDLEVNLAANVLTIKGERRPTQDERKVIRDEAWTGQFQRTLSLPQTVDPDKVDARLADGVLQLKIGKRAETKPRQIEISVK